MTYRITFSVSGRARFLSHLETVDTLLSALRRGGYQIALSQGMKPKPVISLALPRAVGVESERELADVDLVGEHPPEAVAGALAAQLPAGFDVLAVAAVEGRPAASHLAGVAYRIEVADDLDWDTALARYAAATEAVVTRRSPKGEKAVDTKKFCTSVEHAPGRLLVTLELTREGTARPEEIAHAVAAEIGATPTITRLVRTGITLRDRPVGVHT